jgi:hypothetical protein
MTTPQGPNTTPDDAPPPPGTPMREDAADSTELPGNRPDAAEADAAPSAEPGSTYGREEETGVLDTDPSPRSVEEENAATSLDQPSDNSGGE